MIGGELAELREHLRRGDLAAARDVHVREEDQPVAAVYLALAEGDIPHALEAALLCLERGVALRVVLATIVGHGQQTDERWQQAARALPVVDALTRLAEHPDDVDVWERAIRMFVERGNGPRAWALVKGVVVDDTIWERLVVALLDARDILLAVDVVRDACEHFPRAVRLWAMRGMLAAEVSDLDDADRAIAIAAGLSPDEPLVWCARARLSFARGDIESATDASNRAVELGAPRPSVEAIGRAAYWQYSLRG